MIISSIVAMNSVGLIGINNNIPWHLPADLKYFKNKTTGHHVLMGRKCFESIGKPLPNRINIIVTRDTQFAVSNCIVVHSIEEGIAFALKNNEEELFILGGGEIYNQSIEYWNTLYVTWVEYEGEGDVYFPKPNWNNWKQIFEEKHLKDEKNLYNYSFNTYTRIT